MRDRPALLPMTFEKIGYADRGTAILSNVSLTLSAGAPTAIMGPNGAGKTTLLKIGMGLLAPGTGQLAFAGRNAAASDRRAIVFQRPVMLRRSAAGNVAFALSAAGRSADVETIGGLLAQVGLSDLAHRQARKLSGGEQQRLALARALARDPEILFLDEPAASLDPAQTKAVEDTIARVARSGVKVVLATHDIGAAKRLAGDVVFLVHGRVIEHTPAPAFFEAPASEAARRFLAGDLVM